MCLYAFAPGGEEEILGPMRQWVSCCREATALAGHRSGAALPPWRCGLRTAIVGGGKDTW